MQLSEFPEAIAFTRLELLKNRQEAQKIQDWLSQETASIDAAIAFNTDLKNDAQRKVERSRLMQTDDYVAKTIELQHVRDEAALLEIKFQQLVDEFSVTKLEKREAIALLEYQSSIATAPKT